jgi:hypothetical protein
MYDSSFSICSDTHDCVYHPENLGIGYNVVACGVVTTDSIRCNACMGHDSAFV